MRLIDPFRGKYDASDPYGSLAGGRTYPHTGSDWFASAGSAAPAIGTGMVVNAQWHPGNGNTVTVRLPDGHYYAYLHLQAPAIVLVGQTVTIGQTIGHVGNTGTNSRGAHLHITVSDSPGAYAGLPNTIDPWKFINDHINDTDPTTPPIQDGDEMFMISAPNRGIALVGPNYYRSLSAAGGFEEVNAATQIATASYSVTDARFDTIRDICTSGSASLRVPDWPGASVHTPKVDLQPATIAAIATKITS